MNKHRIMMITPGPIYNLDNAFKQRCEKLSDRYRGAIITSGGSYTSAEYGEFKVACLKDPLTKSFISTFSYLFYAFTLLVKAILEKDRYKLCITYDPLKTGLIGLFLKLVTGVKFMVEINGDYTQDIIYSEIKNPYKRRLKKWFMVSIERFVLNHADAVKILHETQIDPFKPLKNNAAIGCFPDYVDSSVFSNLCEKKEILFVGFPFKIKGVDILIEAFKKVASKHPDWKLKILGWYPDQKELQEHIDNHPQIYHHPPIDKIEMIEHMGKCGIFVLASRSEGVARVLIEAMAAGKPRVGSNVGGTSTVINDGVDGFIFESEDVDTLASLMDKLMSDPNLRKTLGENARTRYEADFSLDNYFNSLNEFYSRVLN